MVLSRNRPSPKLENSYKHVMRTNRWKLEMWVALRQHFYHYHMMWTHLFPTNRLRIYYPKSKNSQLIRHQRLVRHMNRELMSSSLGFTRRDLRLQYTTEERLLKSKRYGVHTLRRTNGKLFEPFFCIPSSPVSLYHLSIRPGPGSILLANCTDIHRTSSNNI